MKHALTQMKYRFAVIYETPSKCRLRTRFTRVWSIYGKWVSTRHIAYINTSHLVFFYTWATWPELPFDMRTMGVAVVHVRFLFFGRIYCTIGHKPDMDLEKGNVSRNIQTIDHQSEHLQHLFVFINV